MCAPDDLRRSDQRPFPDLPSIPNEAPELIEEQQESRTWEATTRRWQDVLGSRLLDYNSGFYFLFLYLSLSQYPMTQMVFLIILMVMLILGIREAVLRLQRLEKGIAVFVVLLISCFLERGSFVLSLTHLISTGSLLVGLGLRLSIIDISRRLDRYYA